MLGFGGWPLSSQQDVLLCGQQEVLGMLPPQPGLPGRLDEDADAGQDEVESNAEPCAAHG